MPSSAERAPGVELFCANNDWPLPPNASVAATTPPGVVNVIRPARVGTRVAVLIGIVGLFHLLTLRPGLEWDGDSVMYITHAENLVAGAPYATSGYIQNPYEFVAPQAYPPGYPLLLTPVIAAAGVDTVAIKTTMVVILLALLAAVVLIARGILRPTYLAGLVAAIGLMPWFWHFKHAPVATLPFTVFALLSVWAYDRAGARRQGTAPMALLAGALAYAATATWTLGVILGAVFLLTDLIRRRRPTRALGLALLAWAALAGLQYAVLDTGAGAHEPTHVGATAGTVTAASGYTPLVRRLVDGMADIPQNAAVNAGHYGIGVAKLWDNGASESARNVVLFLALVLAGVGFVRRLRAGPGAVEVFAVLYLMALLPWPFQWTRYLVPLIALKLYYAAVGLQGVQDALGRRGRAVTIAAALMVAASYAGAYATADYDVVEGEMTTPAARAFYRYVRANTPAEGILVGSDSRQLSYFTGRPASVMHMADAEHLLAYIDSLDAAYVVAGPPWRAESVNRVVAGYPRRFEERYRNSEFALYRLRPAGASHPPPEAAAE